VRALISSEVPVNESQPIPRTMLRQMKCDVCRRETHFAVPRRPTLVRYGANIVHHMPCITSTSRIPFVQTLAPFVRFNLTLSYPSRNVPDRFRGAACGEQRVRHLAAT
jgi:hypothetical protein